VWFETFIAAIPDEQTRSTACDKLLSLHREFLGKVEHFRVTSEQLESERNRAEKEALAHLGHQKPGHGNSFKKPVVRRPDQRLEGQDLQDDLMDLSQHVGGILKLLDTLRASISGFEQKRLEYLASESKKLAYLLVNHFAKLSRRPRASVGGVAISRVQELLAELGIANWSPNERLAWCRNCGYHPLYTLVHEQCDKCGWMRCPDCHSCLQGKACSTSAPKPSPRAAAKNLDSSADDEIPF
jgi:hypothetical protein